MLDMIELIGMRVNPRLLWKAICKQVLRPEYGLLRLYEPYYAILPVLFQCFLLLNNH